MLRAFVRRILNTQWIAPPRWLVDYARRDLAREEEKLIAELKEAKAQRDTLLERIARADAALKEVRHLKSQGL